MGLRTTLQRHEGGNQDAHPYANDQDDNRLRETLLNARSETFDAGSRHKHASRKAEPECPDEKSEVHPSILTPIPVLHTCLART